MKTLLVNGSPRQNGNTSVALAEVAKTLEAEGIETMRTLARNLAWLLRSAAAGAVPRPAGEPWRPMHFIR